MKRLAWTLGFWAIIAALCLWGSVLLPRWWLPDLWNWARVLIAIFVVGMAGVLTKTVLDWIAYARGTYDPFERASTGSDQGGTMGRHWEISTRFGRGPTAEWQVDPRSLAKGDIFLGRAPSSLRPVGISTQKHMVTIGQTGSGKSTAALVPNLCFHEGSLLCIDPKGELAEVTAARRGAGGNGVRGMGQEVYILDPFAIVQGATSAAYNVFDEMARVAERDVDRPVSYAGKIADALVKSEGQKEPYWDNAARTLIRGLILYLFQGPAERRNVGELRRLLMEGDAEAWENEPPAIRERITPFDVLFEKMKRVAQGPYRDGIAGAAASMLAMGANQMGSVLTTAQEHTSFLDAPEIRRISARSDFLLDDLKRRKVSVFVCLPINMVSGREGRWLRMFVMLFIDMMMRSKEAPTPPVLLAIDEFPNLGRLDGIEIVAPTMRSYGVRFWAVGQDIEQFKQTYPQSWRSIIGGAEAVQFLGITEPETVKFISELLGKHWVKGWAATGGRNESVVEERPLLDPEQVSRFLSPDLKNQIVWRGNKRPMRLKVTPYYEYLPAWYYSPDLRYAEPWKRARFRPGEGGATPPLPQPAENTIEDEVENEPEPAAPPSLDIRNLFQKALSPFKPESGPVMEMDGHFPGFDDETYTEKDNGEWFWFNVLDPLMVVSKNPEACRRYLEKKAAERKSFVEDVPKGWGPVARSLWDEWRDWLLGFPDAALAFRTQIEVALELQPKWAMEVQRTFGTKPKYTKWYDYLWYAVIKKREKMSLDKVEEDRKSAAILATIKPKEPEGSGLNLFNAPPVPAAPPPPRAPEKIPVESEQKGSGWFDHVVENRGEIPAARVEAPIPDTGDMSFPELDGVLGLETVKDQIRETFHLVQLAKARAEKGMAKIDITHHMVFTGNPGTGKTMMARIVGKIYKRLGLLRSGHMIEADRSKMVAPYRGQTAGKTKDLIEEAMDGILFIDEAYSLVPEDDSPDSYGQEAIAALITEMEEHRDKLVVIAAGYKKEMDRFVKSNPGLESRFKTVIEFPDYSTEELVEIFQIKVKEAGNRLSEAALAKVWDLMMELRKGKGFGNARVVRNLLEKCLARQAKRRALSRGVPMDLTCFEAEDIPNIEDVKKFGMK